MSSIAQNVGPPTIVSSGCAWNVNSVTTPEVATAAADRPEEVWVLVRARRHLRAVREHHLRGQQVVDQSPCRRER